MARILNATLNTLRGLTCIKSEPAVRQEMIALVLAIPVAVPIAPGPGWYVAMVGTLLVTLAVELLNTAVEKLADRVTVEWDPKIGLVKDIGSAAVFCALCLTGLVWATALAIRFGVL